MQVQRIQNNNPNFGQKTFISATPRAKAKLEDVLARSRGKFILEDITDRVSFSPFRSVELAKGSYPKQRILALYTGKSYVSRILDRFCDVKDKESSVCITEKSYKTMQKLLKLTENKQEL